MDFQQAERQFQRLERLYRAGQIDLQQYRTGLAGLRVSDPKGTVWQMQERTGAWYYLCQGQWVAGSPHPVPQGPVRRKFPLWCGLGAAGVVVIFLCTLVSGGGYILYRQFYPGTPQPPVLITFQEQGTTPARAGGGPVTDPHGVTLEVPSASLDADASAQLTALQAGGELRHWSAQGDLLSLTLGVPSSAPWASPADGGVWLVGEGTLTRIDASGSEIWRGSWRAGAGQLSPGAAVDPTDGSAWALDLDTHEAVHVRADWSEAARLPGLHELYAEDPRDGSIWAGDAEYALVHVAADGTQLARIAYDKEHGPWAVEVWVSPLDSTVLATYSEMAFYEPVGYHAAAAATWPDLIRFDAAGNELWRYPRSAAAYNPGDGSVWVYAEAATLAQLSAQGVELRRFTISGSVLGYDPTGNTFWTQGGGELRHVGSDGTSLWSDRLLSYGAFGHDATWVDARDGSLWLKVPGAPRIVHLSSQGVELWSGRLVDDSVSAQAYSRNAQDGSWWVVAQEEGSASPPVRLLRLAPDGAEQWRGDAPGPPYLLVTDEADGSAWVAGGVTADPYQGQQAAASHVARDGTRLGTASFTGSITALASDPRDGSAWIILSPYPLADNVAKLVHLASNGSYLDEIALGAPRPGQAALAVLPRDGSVSGLTAGGPIFRRAADGALVWQFDGVTDPYGLALDPVDGSVWVADVGMGSHLAQHGGAVVHLGASGEELWRSEGFLAPYSVGVDPRDGTVWVCDAGQLVHLGVAPLPFSDVLGRFWALDAIAGCYAAGIVAGYSDGTYRPGEPVARDQMAVYMARAVAGGEAKVPSGPATASFSDVDTSSWAFRYVEYCKAEGVVTGYSDGTYRPTEQVTRDQMAVYVARAMATPTGPADLQHYTPPTTPSFSDVATSQWAYKEVEFCKSQHVVAGYEDGTYRPESPVTRDQMAVYVARAFELL